MSEDEELAQLWRSVAELSAGLSAPDRRAVRDAIADSVLDGYYPTADWIARLVAFAAGEISMADYLTAVIQAGHNRHC